MSSPEVKYPKMAVSAPTITFCIPAIRKEENTYLHFKGMAWKSAHITSTYISRAHITSTYI